MSLSSSGIYEIRSGGNSLNAGYFNTYAAGANFDYTQQNAAQFAYTDLVIASTTTNLTSAARPFSGADVGNSIRIASGTGFTTGLYEIVSVSGTTATMDRSVGTAASTGGTGRLGGSLASTTTAFTTAIAGNGIWARSPVLITGFDVFLTVVNLSADSVIRNSRQLWRELTNERSTVAVPDYVVDSYIQAGLEALNSRVRYHYTDGTVTLTAGTQEYSLPSDTVELKWVELFGIPLQKSSIQEWRRSNIRWRQEAADFPKEWGFYRDRLVLRPTPSTAAVTASSTATIRYISRPADFSSNGMAELNTQHQRIPVYWAVKEWSAAHPDSALAVQRIQYFGQMFEQESMAIAQFYADRELLR